MKYASTALSKILILITVFFVVGCGMNKSNGSSYYNTGGGQTSATFSSLRNTVFGPSCSSCHSWSTSYYGVMNYVSPGNPYASMLFTDCASGKMPQYGYPLSSDQISAIGSWIQSGAPNN